MNFIAPADAKRLHPVCGIIAPGFGLIYRDSGQGTRIRRFSRIFHAFVTAGGYSINGPITVGAENAPSHDTDDRLIAETRTKGTMQ